MAVVKNLMVRVGADMSSFVSGMAKAAGSTKTFKKRVSEDMKASAAHMEQMKNAVYKDGQNEGITDMSNRILTLKERIKELDSIGVGWGYQQYDSAQRELATLQYQLQDYIDTMKTPLDGPKGWVQQMRELEQSQIRLHDAGAIDSLAENGEQLKDLRTKMEGFVQQLREGVETAGPLGAQLTAAKNALKEMEKAGLGAGDEAWDEMYLEVERLTDAVKEYKAELKAVDEQIGYADLTFSDLKSWAVGAFSTAGGAAAKFASGGLSLAKKGVKALGNGLKSMGKGAWSGIKSIASGIFGIGKNCSSADKGLFKMTRSLRNIGIVALGLRAVRGIFGELRTIINQYTRENETLAAQIQSVQSAMGEALAPAINMVVNALSMLLPYVIGVSNAIGTFLSNVFGKGWTTVASGASAAADATNKAAGAQAAYNKSLAGFDEITKLQDSSGGGGGSGSAGSVTNPIEGKLPTWLSDLATQIKAAIAEGDYSGVGDILATKLGDAVDGARKKLNGSKFQSKVKGFVKAFTDGVNGFFGKFSYTEANKESIANKTGKLIGEAVELGLSTLQGIFSGIDFSKIGLSLAQFVNGGISAMNASNVNFGSVLGTMIQSGVNGVGAFLKNVNWSNLGTAIGKNINSFFKKIEWSSVGVTLTDAATGLLDTLATALETVEWTTVADSIKTMLEKIEWKEIWDKAKKVFKNAGVAGESLLGVLLGLDGEAGGFTFDVDWSKVWDDLKDDFKTAEKNRTKENRESFKLGITGFMDKIKNGLTTEEVNRASTEAGKMLSVRAKIEEFWTSVKEFGVNAKAKIQSMTDERKQKWLETKANIKEWWDNRKTKAMEAIANFKTAWDNRKTKAMEAIANFKTAWDNRKTKAMEAIANVKTWWNNTKDRVLKFSANLTTWYDGLKNKWLDFKVNLKKGWAGSVMSALGLGDLSTKLNIKVPKISLKWSSVQVFGKDFWYPTGFNVKWNAKGFVYKGAQYIGMLGNTMIGAGEAGAEALLPLETNTWWMDTIAEKTVQRMTGGSSGGVIQIVVQSILDGKVVSESVVDYCNGQAKSTGVHPMAAYI